VEDGVDQIWVERKQFQMTVGDDDRFPEAFHIAIKTMKKGEKAMFKILDDSVLDMDEVYVDSEELKSNEHNNNTVVAPSGKQMFYEIMVYEMEKAKEKWNAENAERIDMGFKYKEDGNGLFKGQRFKGAISKYEKALEWIDVDFSDDELLKKKQELTISVNNNMALICSKKKDWSAATEHATKALDVEPNNVKALMRRGQAQMQNGNLEEAKRDLKRALSLDKSNTVIKKLLKVCTAKHKAYVEKQQKLYANMFGGGKKKKKRKVAQKKEEEDQKETGTEKPAETEEAVDKECGGCCGDKDGDAMDVDKEQAVSV